MGQILSLVGEVGLGALLAKAVGGDWKLGGAAGLGCFVLVLLLRIPKSYRVPEKGGVVISGASSGIGRVAVATALRAICSLPRPTANLIGASIWEQAPADW